MTAQRKPDETRLAYAVNALNAAVQALCSPQCRYLNNQHQQAPSLYMQLRDTITGLRNNGHNGGHMSQPPIWVAAADKLNEIDTAVECWHPQLAGAPVTPGRLRSLAQNGSTGGGWRPQDVHQVRQIAKVCDAWVQEITNLLDPEHVKNFRTPEGDGFAQCPQCGRETTYRVDPSDGESKRVPVLQWVAETGTTCIVCRAHWGPELTMFVARQLGFERPEGVLE